MSIVELKKLTLCGLSSEKTVVLKKLQALGGAHLISLNKQVHSTEAATQKHTKKALQALKYLNQCAKKRHQLINKEHFVLDEIVEQVLNVQMAIRDLSDQRDFLINRIKKVKPWGDFTLAKEGELGGIKCWFYIIPKRLMKGLHNSLIFQVVHKDNIHCYVVVLAEVEPLANTVPVPRTHTGSIPLSRLIKNLEAIELALEDKQAERESLTRWIALITLSLAENKDNSALKVASTLTLEDQELLAIQAWVPLKNISKFKQFARQNDLACLVEDICQQDNPPTLLENAESLAGGEEVVKFYQTPAYNGWDPSVVVFFSFAFFFAMIVSDAGYASVFALLLMFK